MEKVYEELEEAKQEIENLKSQLKKRSESYKSVKQSQTHHCTKLQDANSIIEKQNQELADKAEEIFSIKELNQELKSKIVGKDSAITRLNSAIDKLRSDFYEKLKRCEDEYGRLLVALDEANEKNRDGEGRISELEGENKRLKGLLSAKEKRCGDSGSVREGNGSSELRRRDDFLEEIEEERRKVEEQLKWKTEQFNHLEEAHEKLRKKFNEIKREAENEKSMLLDEISSLETRLCEASSSSSSGGVKNQLDMCKQALEHEENRTRNANDVNVTDLKHSLRVQEMISKDLEYKARQLEQENHQLLASLKDLQEDQIQLASTPNSSLTRIRSKLKSLEQRHKECDSNLRMKEAEWISKVDKLTQELSDCKFTLKIKDEAVDKLRVELDTCHSSMTELKLQNEELSLMLQLLKSEFTEVQSTHANEKAEMDSNGRENECSVISLMEQLEMKNASLVEARDELEKERENASSLMRRLHALNVVQEERQQREKENSLQKLCQDMMIEESNSSPDRLNEEDGGLEIKLKQELQEMYDAMESVNSELAEQIYEKSEIELELQIWKSTAEQLRVQLEVNQKVRIQLESSLLEQAEFEEVLRLDIDRLHQIAESKDRRINYLQEQIALLDRGHIVSGEASRNYLANESCHLPRTEDDYVKSRDADEIERLEQESLRRELEGAILAQIRAERTIKEVIKLSGNSENLLAIIEKLCIGIGNFSGEETILTAMLGKIVQNIGHEIGVDLHGYERWCPAKANVSLQLYPLAKTCEVAVSERSPFREIN